MPGSRDRSSRRSSAKGSTSSISIGVKPRWREPSSGESIWCCSISRCRTWTDSTSAEASGAKDPYLPVIMLTARAEEVDLVVGLDAGADDYVSKPFRVAELLARIGARLRSRQPAGRAASPMVAGAAGEVGVRVDVGAHRAWRDAEELDLTPTEFDLLALLVSEAGQTVTRQRIMRTVWDEHWWGPTRTLDMHISSLRRKLGGRAGGAIVTVRGVGFRFDPTSG
jgi:DNA-binding response OmpR family regulator